jgi:hypothetical protein
MVEYSHNHSLTTTPEMSPFFTPFEFEAHTKWSIEVDVKKCWKYVLY